MHTIAVISQKGGSGKTTTLLNLAVAAYQDDAAQVLIIDLDLQASATQWHKARADKSPHVQPTHPAGGVIERPW